MYYSIKAYEELDNRKRDNLIEKRDKILTKFYKYNDELQNEKDYLDKIAAELENKSTEKSLKELVYNNCISKKTRWSFFAMMAYNFWPTVSGMAYADNYMSVIFDKLVYDGFGYKLTFYSGFFCIAGSVCCVFMIERVNRLTILCGSQLVIIICMWLLAFSFYFNFVNLAVCVNLVFIFTLYFGINGICYVFVNELSEPFTVGIGFGVGWGMRAVVGLLLPYMYDN